MDDAPKSLHGLAWWFEPLPVGRARVLLTIVFAGMALLTLGGALSYASESPDLHGGTGAATRYWSLVFLFHALAFGGAALIGMFPRLARIEAKAAWLIILAVAGIGGLTLRFGGATVAGEYTSTLTRIYLPAVVPIVVGLFWRESRV